MTYQNLCLQSEAGTATVTLNRPQRRNALSLEVTTQLAATTSDAQVAGTVSWVFARLTA
jgi:enoyl-CoA hydratase/carnithine racemase